jgi:hypothetical protein
MTVNDDAAKRAGESSKHVVIVGKFSLRPKIDKPYETYSFNDAEDGIRRDFPFDLATSEEEIKVDANRTFRTLGVHMAAEVREKVGDKKVIVVKHEGKSDEEIDLVGFLPVTGTALEKELGTAGGDFDCVKLGEKLWTDLKRNLDALIPFSGPGFDALLSEAVFFSYPKTRKHRILTDLRRIIYADTFNRLLTTYFRATDEDAGQIPEEGEPTKILGKLKDAFPKAIFAKDAPTEDEANELCDEVIAHIAALRGWLRSSDPRKRNKFSALGKPKPSENGEVQNANGGANSTFLDVLKAAKIDADSNKSFPWLYEEYMEANVKATGIARSETLMMFMVRQMYEEWAGGPIKDTDSMKKAVFKNVYNRSGQWSPAVLTDEQESKFNQSFLDTLEKYKKKYQSDASQTAKLILNHIERMEAADEQERKPGRKYTLDRLLFEIGEIVGDLNNKYIPHEAQVAAIWERAIKQFAVAERKVKSLFKEENGRIVLEGAAHGKAAQTLQDNLKATFENLDLEFSKAQTELTGKEPKLSSLGSISLELATSLNDVVKANRSDKPEDLLKEMLVKLSERKGQVTTSPLQFFVDAKTEIDKAGETLWRGMVEGLKSAAKDGALAPGSDTLGGLQNPHTEPKVIPKGTRFSPPTAAAPAPNPAAVSAAASVGSSSVKSAEGQPKTGKETPKKPDTKSSRSNSDSGDNAPGWKDLLSDPSGSQEVSVESNGELVTQTELTPDLFLALLKDSAKEEGKKRLLEGHWLGLENAADVVRGFREQTSTDDDFRGKLNDSDTEPRKRKAWMEAELFAELLLGTPKDAAVLDQHDRSIMAGLCFERLLHTDPKKVRLAELLVAKTEDEAKKYIDEVYQAAERKTEDLKKNLRPYFADVKDVTELLSALRQSRDTGWVTFVNTTIAERGDSLYTRDLEPIFESARGPEADKHIPPPGIVYVTRQAFHPDLEERSLKPIKVKMETVPNRSPFWVNADKKPEKALIATNELPAQVGWPLYVGRGFEPAGFPSITVDVEKLRTLILFLLGQHPNQILGASLVQAYHKHTNTSATQDTTFSKFWLDVLTDDARRDLSAVLSSHTVAHAIAVRQIAMQMRDATLPDFGTSLEWAVRFVGERFRPDSSPASQDWLRERVWWWKKEWVQASTSALTGNGGFAQQAPEDAKERFAIGESSKTLTDIPYGNLVDRFKLIHPR